MHDKFLDTETHAYKNGYGAYDDGELLHHNPFHPDEERTEWTAWRAGWWDAETDADKQAMEATK